MQWHPFLSGEEQRLRNYSLGGQTSRSIVAKNQTLPCRNSPSPTSMQSELRMRRLQLMPLCIGMQRCRRLTGPPGLPRVSWFIHSCHLTDSSYSTIAAVTWITQLVVLPLRTRAASSLFLSLFSFLLLLLYSAFFVTLDSSTSSLTPLFAVICDYFQHDLAWFIAWLM